LNHQKKSSAQFPFFGGGFLLEKQLKKLQKCNFATFGSSYLFELKTIKKKVPTSKSCKVATLQHFLQLFSFFPTKTPAKKLAELLVPTFGFLSTFQLQKQFPEPASY